MKEKIIRIARDLSDNRITLTQAKKQLFTLLENDNRPEWLDESDIEMAMMYWKDGQKAGALKYITELARPHKTNPMKWAHDFLINESKQSNEST